MKSYLQTAITMAALVAISASCNQIDPDEIEASRQKAESEYFSFETSRQARISVSLGEYASGAPVRVYSSDDFDSEPILTFFLDKSGSFNDILTIPAAVSKAWIECDAIGVPQAIEATVTSDGISASYTASKATKSSALRTKAGDGLQVWKIDSPYNVYSICYWEPSADLKYKFGGYEDRNGICSKAALTSAFTTAINSALATDNSAFVQNASIVNTSILSSYTDEDGVTHDVTDAEVSLTLLNETASYLNTFGYYYYRTDTPPQSIDDLELFIIFPNYSIQNNNPFGRKDTNRNRYVDPAVCKAPCEAFTTVKLLFKDPQSGEIGTAFPPGYTIGYFLIPDGFQPGWSYDSSQPSYIDGTAAWIDFSNCTTTYDNINTKSYNRQIIFSNENLNPGKKSRYISFEHEGRVVYGVEDGVDNSYKDELFCVTANPSYAIANPERIELEQIAEANKPVEQTTTSSYAFEDIWPWGGDYDLNDVIIRHQRALTITVDNYVTKITDSFEAVQPANSASQSDAFAIQLPSGQLGTLTIGSGIKDERNASGSLIIFSDTGAERGTVRTVTRTFGSTALKLSEVIDELNPYIIPGYISDPSSESRIEVHMPKHEATSLADLSKKGKGEEAFYIHNTGDYPYAITIPGDFTPATERTSISNDYPDFTLWVASSGASNTDWYLNHK